MIEKVTRMNALYDSYESLLTAKQKVYFEMYYHEDLSLSEIADQFGISRTAVFDNIKRTEKALEGYEGKLNILANSEKRLALLGDLSQAANPLEMKAAIEKLIALEESE